MNGTILVMGECLAELNNINGVATFESSPVQTFLSSIEAFIDGGDIEEEEDAEELDNDTDGDDDAQIEAVFALVANVTPADQSPLQKKICELRQRLKEIQSEMVRLQHERTKITNHLEKARRLLRKMKDKLKEFKNDRKKSGDGVEAAMFEILKSCYHIQLPAYHGGKLIGKDCQKMMSNADVIFKQFADILKDPSNRRSDCALNNDEIDLLCQQFADLSMLWDGALSYASKIDPSEEDIVMYERFAKAAIFSHQSMGCSVTHKGHLMWAHTACQMRNIPGDMSHECLSVCCT